MKKILIILLIAIMNLLISHNITFASQTNETGIEETTIQEQEEQYGISEFIEQSKKYTENIDLSQIYNDSITGKFDNNLIMDILLTLLGDNFKNSLLTISSIAIVVIINSILKAISENLGNQSVSKIAFFIQYIIIVTLLMKNFSDILESIKIAVQNLSSFSTILIPLLTMLITATGNLTTSSLIEPILLSMVTFISSLITNIIIPIILVSTALGIISKFSEQVKVERLSKLLNKGTVWILTTVLGIFIGIASLESGLTGNVDNLTKKAGKSIISTAVPVVGGILGDAIDTIIGYTNVIKSATGIIGIVVIISICLKPIINLATLTILYKLSASLCEPIADKKIVELIEIMSNTFKTMLAVMFSITAMIVIGIALIIKISS
ncbi:MAG: stage III sporulation protein AE [Clostridia bacterium]|nr:stage III sporulation protein AE [Clostridia bacterium]